MWIQVKLEQRCRMKAIPGFAGNFPIGYKEGYFSATERAPSETIMNIFYLRSFQPAAVWFQ